jgi:hypothetical protein
MIANFLRRFAAAPIVADPPAAGAPEPAAEHASGVDNLGPIGPDLSTAPAPAPEPISMGRQWVLALLAARAQSEEHFAAQMANFRTVFLLSPRPHNFVDPILAEAKATDGELYRVLCDAINFGRS